MLDNKLTIRVSGSGLDLVLLHGWGMNSGAFDHWLPMLTEGFRVSLIDLPGFGSNATVFPQPYSLADLSTMLLEYIPQGAVIVGWSLGGLVAQQLVLQSSQRFSGLVTIASSPCFAQSNAWAGIRTEVLNAFKQQLIASYDKTLDRFLAIQALGTKQSRAQIKAFKTAIKRYPDPSDLALQDALNLLEKTDLRDQIGNIKLPTLRIYGKRDTLVPISAVDNIHALHPSSDNVILPDASHAPFISHPETTSQIIHQFVYGNINKSR